jgi:hypothetical protein
LSFTYNGDEILEKEPDVALFLEGILESPENYGMYAYMRRALASYIRGSSLRTHSFYVINGERGGYHTLSFSATGKTFYSEGAWAMDTEADLDS